MRACAVRARGGLGTRLTRVLKTRLTRVSGPDLHGFRGPAYGGQGLGRRGPPRHSPRGACGCARLAGCCESTSREPGRNRLFGRRGCGPRPPHACRGVTQCRRVYEGEEKKGRTGGGPRARLRPPGDLRPCLGGDDGLARHPSQVPYLNWTPSRVPLSGLEDIACSATGGSWWGPPPGAAAAQAARSTGMPGYGTGARAQVLPDGLGGLLAGSNT